MEIKDTYHTKNIIYYKLWFLYNWHGFLELLNYSRSPGTLLVKLHWHPSFWTLPTSHHH